MNGLQNSTNSTTLNTSHSKKIEVDITKICKLVDLIKNCKDDDFNLLFAKYFKLKYGHNDNENNLRIFTAFLIENIKLYIKCYNKFPCKGLPSPELKWLSIKVTQFEEDFHEILYFGQRDISQDIRNEIDRILSIVVN